MGNNNNGIQLFSNPAFGNVRIVMRDDNPWFVAKDVCDCLTITDASQACKNLDDDEKQVVTRDFDTLLFTESKAQAMTLISESGLYTLIMRSNKPEAKEFRKWVTSEVLPSIRKSGVYATDNFIQKTIDDPDWAISILQQIKFEREQKELALRQRDEAIRTKAWIGSKRESTCMNEVKRFKGENKRLIDENTSLQIRIGEEENHKTVKQLTWLRKYFVFIDTKQWNYTSAAVGNELKRISILRGMRIDRTVDPNWGECNSYHIDIISEFREKLDTDRNYMDNRNKRNAKYPVRRI